MKGPEPLGDSKPKDQPIKLLTWNYPQEHMVEHIMREVNGYDYRTIPATWEFSHNTVRFDPTTFICFTIALPAT